MANTTLKVRIKHGSDTEENLTSKNPVLLDGEIVYIKSTNKYKKGNGSSKWTELPLLEDLDTYEKQKLKTIDLDVTQTSHGLMTATDKKKLDEFNAANTYASIDYVTERISNFEYLKKAVVSALPSASKAEENVIYMIPKTSSEANNSYDEFIYINSVFEKIGDNQSKLDPLTNSDIDEILGGKYNSPTSGLDNVVLA